MCKGYGIDKRAFAAFCRQLLYSLSDARAANFLRGPLCGAAEGADDVGPIASVPKFLSLFGEGPGPGAQTATSAGAAPSRAAHAA